MILFLYIKTHNITTTTPQSNKPVPMTAPSLYQFCMSCAASKAGNIYEQCESCYNRAAKERKFNPIDGSALENEYMYNGKLFKDMMQGEAMLQSGAMLEGKKVALTNAVFVLDVTGSMMAYIEAAKNNILDIINSFETNQKQIFKKFYQEEYKHIIQCAVVPYRDFGDKIPAPLKFTTDGLAVKKYLSTLEATGGDDIPEDLYGAMLKSVTDLDWGVNHPLTTNYIMIITDAPGHGPLLCQNENDNHPKANTEQDWKTLIATIQSKSIDLQFYQSGRITPDLDRTTKFISSHYDHVEKNYKMMVTPLPVADLNNFTSICTATSGASSGMSRARSGYLTKGDVTA